MAGDLEFKDENTLKRLLLFDFFRGPDSTGFAALRKNGDTKIAKIGSHPVDLFDTKSFNEACSGYQSTVFLGHNRLATKGKVNAINAHPYEFGNIIGAHNGTLDAGSWAALEKAIGEQTDVDSQAIIMAISKLGIEETVKLMSGAWALVWIDTEAKTLNFLRNKERPFWTGITKDCKKLIWASEWPIMEAALKTSTTDYELFHDEKGYRFWATEENWWYRFDIEALKKGAKDPPRPLVKELKGKEAAAAGNGQGPFATGFHMHGNNHQTTNHHTTQTTQRVGSRAGQGAGTGKSPVYNLIGSSRNPFAGVISEERFQEMARYGCAWCHGDIDYQAPGLLVIEGDDCIVCEDCTHADYTRIVLTPSDFKKFGDNEATAKM